MTQRAALDYSAVCHLSLKEIWSEGVCCTTVWAEYMIGGGAAAPHCRGGRVVARAADVNVDSVTDC